uniref:Uncharacterized protein n=1 Tax=Odontella aurita TaxID=265563 RepID=A0A7S4N0Y1_9STRA
MLITILPPKILLIPRQKGSSPSRSVTRTTHMPTSMRSRLLPKPQAAIDARDRLAGLLVSDIYVLEWVAEGAPSSIAHSHISINLDHGLLRNKLKAVGPVLSLGVRTLNFSKDIDSFFLRRSGTSPETKKTKL